MAPVVRKTAFSRRGSTGLSGNLEAEAEPPTQDVLQGCPLSYYQGLLLGNLDVHTSKNASVRRLNVYEWMDRNALGDEYGALQMNMAKKTEFVCLLNTASISAGPKVKDLEQFILNDTVGHNILKMAFSYKKGELNSYFTGHEERIFIFKLRQVLDSLTNTGVPLGLALEGIWRSLEECLEDPLRFEYVPRISEDMETIFHQQGLISMRNKEGEHTFWGPSMFFQKKIKPANIGAFKIRVPSLDAARIIKERKAILQDGFAFFSPYNLPMFLLGRFSRLLKDEIEHIQSFDCEDDVETLLNHPLMGNFVKTLSLMQAQKENHVSSHKKLGVTPMDSITATTVLDVIHCMPPCARRMMMALKKDKHLKHYARQQLSIFLKDINMSVNEQISYWSKNWGEAEKFQKEHTYTIRYQYGLEGKRQVRAMFSCRTMLSNTFPVAGSSEAHGCPYRELKENTLREFLPVIGVNKAMDIEDICGMTKNNEFQRACQRTFSALFPHYDACAVGNHPIAYYREACNACSENVLKQ